MKKALCIFLILLILCSACAEQEMTTEFTADEWPSGGGPTDTDVEGGIRFASFENGIWITGRTTSDEALLIPQTIRGLRVIGIAKSAFEGDASLKRVILPEGLEFIEEKAFHGCSALTREGVSVPTNATIAVASDAFDFEWSSVAPKPTQSPRNIALAHVAPIADQIFTGRAITPKIEVRYGGDLLIEGVDYRIEFSDNVRHGTALISIEGLHGYTGQKFAAFDIVAANSGVEYTGDDGYRPAISGTPEGDFEAYSTGDEPSEQEDVFMFLGAVDANGEMVACEFDEIREEEEALLRLCVQTEEKTSVVLQLNADRVRQWRSEGIKKVALEAFDAALEIDLKALEAPMPFVQTVEQTDFLTGQVQKSALGEARWLPAELCRFELGTARDIYVEGWDYAEQSVRVHIEAQTGLFTSQMLREGMTLALSGDGTPLGVSPDGQPLGLEIDGLRILAPVDGYYTLSPFDSLEQYPQS